MRSAPGAVSLTLGQSPQLYAIHVQVSGKLSRRWLQAQVSISGSTAAVRRYDVLVRGRRIAVIHTRGSNFVVRTRVRKLPEADHRRREGQPRTDARDGPRERQRPAGEQAVHRSRPHARADVGVHRIWQRLGRPAGARVGAAAGRPAPVQTPGTISIGGSETVGALVADLIYYYRRATSGALRASRSSRAAREVGVADALRGVVNVGLAARDRRPSDPPGMVFTPMAGSAVCIATNRQQPDPQHHARPAARRRRGPAHDLVEVPGLAAPATRSPSSPSRSSKARRACSTTTFLTPDVPRVYQPRC